MSTGSFGKSSLPPGFKFRKALASLNLVTLTAGIWKKVKHNYIHLNKSITKERTSTLLESKQTNRKPQKIRFFPKLVNQGEKQVDSMQNPCFCPTQAKVKYATTVLNI